jgi:hypothetical protein
MSYLLLKHILADTPSKEDIHYLEKLITESKLDIADIVECTLLSDCNRLTLNELIHTTLQMIFERFNVSVYKTYKVSLPEPKINANFRESSIQSEIECDFMNLTAENLEIAYKAQTLLN